MMSKNTKWFISPYIILFVVIIGIYLISLKIGGSTQDLSYSQFKQRLSKDKIETVQISPSKEESVYNISDKLKGSNNETYYVKAPLSDETLNNIYDYQSKNKFSITIKQDPSSGLLVKLLDWLPYLVIGLGLLWFLNKQLGAANKSMEFGKSRAKLQSDKDKVNFDNVAGLIEEKEELKELIDFLKDPK